jgi:hypothetical protein
MPFPDRNADANYDGISDCNSPTSAFNYNLLIGQLPVYGQGNPCTAPQVGVGENYQDAQGNRLWYAVSRNLMHKYESAATAPIDPIINPSVISNPVYPWLIVRDKNGNVLSDRVAAVIIAPGNALSGQNRAGAAPNANHYLDSFSIGATTYSNANYDLPNEDFIIGQDSRDVTDADTSVNKPYYFNDKLVYITIDELMQAVTNRASTEASKLLKQYRIKNGRFPYAADLGATLNNHNSEGVSTKGMLPIDVTDVCQCIDSTTCTCNFGAIESVIMYRDNGTWNNTLDSGQCRSNLKPTNKECACSGAGSCSRTFVSPPSTTSFTCLANGDCSHTLVTPNNKFIFKPAIHSDIYSATNNCQVNGVVVECNDAGDFKIGLNEPDWFKESLWQDYFYYEWSSSANLQAGDKAGIDALLISVGGILAATEAQPAIAQVRPSNDINDYLDSIENTDNDLSFDAVHKQKSNLYNDQIYIISP